MKPSGRSLRGKSDTPSLLTLFTRRAKHSRHLLVDLLTARGRKFATRDCCKGCFSAVRSSKASNPGFSHRVGGVSESRLLAHDHDPLLPSSCLRGFQLADGRLLFGMSRRFIDKTCDLG